MKKYLDSIRKDSKYIEISKKILNTVLILIFGILLGIFSKWLNNLAIDDSIWWQSIIGTLDLKNIFSEFAIWILLVVSISIYSNSPKRASINVFMFFIGVNVNIIYIQLFIAVLIRMNICRFGMA